MINKQNAIFKQCQDYLLKIDQIFNKCIKYQNELDEIIDDNYDMFYELVSLGEISNDWYIDLEVVKEIINFKNSNKPEFYWLFILFLAKKINIFCLALCEYDLLNLDLMEDIFGDEYFEIEFDNWQIIHQSTDIILDALSYVMDNPNINNVDNFILIYQKYLKQHHRKDFSIQKFIILLNSQLSIKQK
ncbi:hypothetical protein GE118_02295 [Mycoplasma sp. NEAQ87857]|uniref:hypothetical protein n=1 Tax=Mycoplasma sp. NEAQ87857 TaxID=2683967 RepID=UPI0013178B02|nr:hypothetical protein [Mycoplasma sp. NEAQ87857]QGZ97624.1 hypothetical protein GE118_02295 [Mycoplasma sp. NEAQ87857]